MNVSKHYMGIAVVMFCFSAIPAAAQDAGEYLKQYFTGAAIQFGYGSGTSSNNPRVELWIHYCPNGMFFSSGQSCRPNIIAKGYQCSPIQDAGQWQVSVQNGQPMIQWFSNSTGPGGMVVEIRGDGTVSDLRGNPFNRVGKAQCG